MPAGPLSIETRLLLPLGVWLAYAGDRLADARRIDEPRRSRHVFSRRHAGQLLTAWILVCAMAILLGFRALHGTRFVAAAGMIVFLIAYLTATQVWRRGRALVPRELVVGLTFAVGTTLFLAPGIGEAPPLTWLGATLSFAALCVWNCVVVSWLERHEDRRVGEFSAATSGLLDVGTMRALGLGLATLALVPVAAIWVQAVAAGDSDTARRRFVLLLAVAVGFQGLFAQLRIASARAEPAALAPWSDAMLLLPAPLLLFALLPNW